MNRLPEVKSFLKDGEAEWYRGVEVKYIHGRKAILTILEDGVEKEKVTLSELKSKADMHKMMVAKGFVKKSDDDIAQIRAQIAEEKAAEEKKKVALDEERKMKQEERRKKWKNEAKMTPRLGARLRKKVEDVKKEEPGEVDILKDKPTEQKATKMEERREQGFEGSVREMIEKEEGTPPTSWLPLLLFGLIIFAGISWRGGRLIRRIQKTVLGNRQRSA